MEFISDFFDLPNKFQILVASLCPSIFGHEIIKASLLLGLVGGCQRYTDDPRLDNFIDPMVFELSKELLGDTWRQILQYTYNNDYHISVSSQFAETFISLSSVILV